MSNALAKFRKPEEKKEEPAVGILQTRCGSERAVQLDQPVPRTVSVGLAKLTEDPNEPAEERVFYLTAQGTHPKVKGPVYLYREGPGKPKSLLVLP